MIDPSDRDVLGQTGHESGLLLHEQLTAATAFGAVAVVACAFAAVRVRLNANLSTSSRTARSSTD